MAKLLATELSKKTADECLQFYGGFGTVEEYPIERFFRDQRSMMITEGPIEEAHAFIQTMSQLGTRLGPMFLQLPPRFSPRFVTALKAFLSAWPRDVRLAVEVRHLDWFDSPNDEMIDQLLSDHNMARVTIDTRPIRSLLGETILAGSTYESLLEAREHKPDLPVVPKRTSDFVFVRYIGHPDLEVNRPFLEEWVGNGRGLGLFGRAQRRQRADQDEEQHASCPHGNPYEMLGINGRAELTRQVRMYSLRTDLAIWCFGNLAIWRFGDLASRSCILPP